MKKDRLVWMASVALSLAISSSAQAQHTGKGLAKRLARLQNKGVMVGHQDDPVYGTTWKWDEGKSDVLFTSGDYPAVMGFDLGELEQGFDKNLDGVPFDRMRREIIAQHERGGIVTLSWHPWNPATGKNAWDPTGDAVAKILPGGPLTWKLDWWLDRVAAFISSLKTADGKAVPVVFRPWHEMNGGWFWWGAKSCSAEQFKQLFRYTYDRLSHRHGLNNIVWAWSPNLSDDKSEQAFVERYPGADVVDMIGVDVYEFDGNDEGYARNLRATIEVMNEVAKKEGKLATVSETGCRGIAHKPGWFTQTLQPVLQDYRLSYVLFWRNAWDRPEEEAYLPGVGDASVDDFKAWTEMKGVLTCKEIK